MAGVKFNRECTCGLECEQLCICSAEKTAMVEHIKRIELELDERIKAGEELFKCYQVLESKCAAMLEAFEKDASLNFRLGQTNMKLRSENKALSGQCSAMREALEWVTVEYPELHPEKDPTLPTSKALQFKP